MLKTAASKIKTFILEEKFFVVAFCGFLVFSGFTMWDLHSRVEAQSKETKRARENGLWCIKIYLAPINGGHQYRYSDKEPELKSGESGIILSFSREGGTQVETYPKDTFIKVLPPNAENSPRKGTPHAGTNPGAGSK